MPIPSGIIKEKTPNARSTDHVLVDYAYTWDDAWSSGDFAKWDYAGDSWDGIAAYNAFDPRGRIADKVPSAGMRTF